MTKRELIEALAEWPDDAVVRVRASCCMDLHAVEAVRLPEDGRDLVKDDEDVAVIDATGIG